MYRLGQIAVGFRTHVRPVELLVQEHGQGDDEPDVARPEEEEPRRGEAVDRSGLRQDRAQWRLLPRLTDVLVQQHEQRHHRDGEHARHRVQRVVVAENAQQCGAEEEADALECVLRPGEDRDEPEQCAFASPTVSTGPVALPSL